MEDVYITGRKINELNNLKIDTTSAIEYANELEGLNTKQAKLVLSTQDFSDSLKQEILSMARLTDATYELTTAELEKILITENRNKNQAEALLINTGLITSETTEATATHVVTGEKLKELITTGKLTKEEAKLIAARNNATLASGKESAFLLAGIGSKIKGAGVALKGLGTGILTIAQAHPVIAGVTAALALCGGTALVNKIKQEKAAKAIKEAYEEAKNAIAEINNTYSTNSSQVKEVSKEYAELAQGVDLLTNENKNLSTEKYERFLELSNQLSKLYPSLTENFDENSNAILGLSGDVDTIVGSLDNLIERQRILANQEIMKQMPSLFNGYSKNVTDLKTQKENYEKIRDEIQRAYDTLNSWDGSILFKFDGTQMTESVDGVKREIFDYANALDILEIKYDITNEYNGIRIKADYDPDGNDLHNIYVSAFTKAFDDVKYVAQQIEDEKSSMNQYFNAWLQGEFFYNHIEDNRLQKAIQDMIFNFDWSDLPEGIDKSNWDDVSEYFRRNILFAINNISNSEVSEALAKIYSGSLNSGELLDAIDKVQKYFGTEDPISVSLQPKLDDTQPLINKVKEKLQKDFGDKVGELTLEELHIAAEQVEVPEGTTISWDELKTKIKEVQDSQSIEPTLLSEDNRKVIDDYKTKLQELYAALNLFRTGEMSRSDIDELITKFPELAMYVDILEEGIESLIEKELVGLGKAFDGAISEDFLRKIAECSVKQTAITDSFKTTTSFLNKMTSAYKNVSEAMKQYNETGHISLELLETLMEMKPEYLGALMDEWGNIDNATDAYKAYMKVRAKDYLNSAHEELVLNQRKLYAEHQKRIEGLEFPKESDDSKEAEIYRASLKQYKEEVKVYENSWASKNKFYTMILNDEWDGIFSSSSTSDFEQHIDWTSHYISTLQDKVSSLQNTLSDTSGYDNQIKEIDKLITAQKNLSGGYEKTRDTYQAKYENILNNGILAEQGLTEAVRNKIEKDENFSDEDFSIEDFIANNIESGDISLEQQIYEALQEAIDWYNKKSEADKNILKIKSEIDESELSKYDVLRKKSEAYIDTLKNSQKSITDTIDFNGNKATEEQYNNLILYQMGIRKVLEDRYEYESSLLETLTPETDQYTEQEKLVRECADGLAECDKNIKDWRLDMLRLELETIDDEIDSINDKIKANQDEIDEKDKLISGAIGILNQEVKVQEGLRDVIQERIDALQEENDEHERALALEKAKYELQRAYSQRTVKLYSGEERGFIYTQDHESVRDAQENLDKLEYEETIHALQEQVGYYDDIIDNLNAIKDSWSNISSAAQEFLEIESVIAKYGVGIKDSILSGSYDTDGLTQSYKGLLHLGEEFDNDLKKQEDLRSDFEKSIEQFQNGTITLEQCLTDIGMLLGKVYDISESELHEKTENILHSIGFLPSEADNAGNMVKALEKEVKNSTDNIKDDINQIAEDVDDTSSIAAGKVTENLIGETDKQRIIITDFAGYIDYVFTTMCNTILSIFQLLSNAMKDIFAPANTELTDIELGAMSNGSTTTNTGKDLTQSAPSIGEEYSTASTYQEGNAVLTPFQNEQFETLIKNIPNMSALIPYHAVFTPNLNNSPTSITPVVQNITLTLPNVTNENGYNNLVDALKSLPLDTVQYTHKK